MARLQVEQVNQIDTSVECPDASSKMAALSQHVLSALRRIGVDTWTAVAIWVLVLGVALACGGHLRFTASTMWAPLLAALLGMTACAATRRPFWHGLAEWGPFILILSLYMQIDPYTRLIQPQPVDAKLAAIDTALFGGVPSELLAPYRSPWLTELMAAGYSCYLVLMFCVAPAYIPTVADPAPRMRYRQAFRATQTALVLELGLGFFLYMLVPARGPRYFFPDAAPLHGALGYYDWAIAGWNAMQACHHDAFPSLHTATGVVSILFSLRLRRLFRPLPYLISVPAIVLILSTVYLRMHYVVDVFAGILHGLFSAWLGQYLVVRFHGPDVPDGVSPSSASDPSQDAHAVTP